jgi:hypothetical protein
MEEKAFNSEQGRRVCDRTISEAALDEALADSFPASDPIPWTLGVSAFPERLRGDTYSSLSQPTARDVRIN